MKRINEVKGKIEQSKNTREKAEADLNGVYSEIEGLRATISTYETGEMTMVDQTVMEPSVP